MKSWKVWFAWGLLIFILSPLAVVFLSKSGEAAVWVWAWLAVWAVFLWTSWDDLTKGLVLIVGSCWVAIAGRVFVHEAAPVLDAVQNMMLLIGGGVGGNFIYAYLAKRQADRKKAQGSKH